ncbi:phage head morphogenesis protein [Anaerosalibacter bizertensis]|uniref:Phage head morphogenesis protein n=1 Tax=Anaerosalibacter bizertensis TaxID=932217 RepID=A0A844FI67_9FIRM|nr:minor capsid protein [Anaerosalibacter bizertensis]MSS43783.1 phage head morphogenesis protein [Anaerosalibacter bizertensis]
MKKKYKEMYLEHEKEGYEIAEEKSKEIYKKQKEDREKLLDEIGRVVLTYAVIDGVIDLTTKQKRKLNKKFNKTIKNLTRNQSTSEEKVINDILETVTKERYNKNGYLMSIGMKFDMKRFSDSKMKEIVNNTIDGKTWSDRNWTNKKKLERTLKREVNRLFQGETNINDIDKVIRDKFSQNAYNSKRLIETEVARCQAEANDLFAREHDVEKQMYVATLDERTTEQCQNLDSNIYDIDDTDKPIPPLHPLCRSTLVNLPSVDWDFDTRKDNETKGYIDFMTYEEWKEQNNID